MLPLSFYANLCKIIASYLLNDQNLNQKFYLIIRKIINSLKNKNSILLNQISSHKNAFFKYFRSVTAM